MRYERQYADMKGKAKETIIWAKLREVGDSDLQAAAEARKQRIKRQKTNNFHYQVFING